MFNGCCTKTTIGNSDINQKPHFSSRLGFSFFYDVLKPPLKILRINRPHSQLRLIPQILSEKEQSINVTVQVVQEMLTEVGVGTAGKSDGA